MAKAGKTFFCRNCGAEAAQWMGKCTSCGEWNTYIEEVVSKSPTGRIKTATYSESIPESLDSIKATGAHRLSLPDQELNRVLGGGLVSGSVVLLGGEPGIGKSTLLLQLSMEMKTKKVLYVSGEESAQQIRLRAERLGSVNGNCMVYTETSMQRILSEVEKLQPDLLIVDSVQTIYTERVDSAAGSITQIREATSELLRMAKSVGIPVFIIGHITKDGTIAGPKLLEHMVDAVLQFEGDRNHVFRIIRSLKNRYGSTNEIGIYKMSGSGLEQVLNPSDVLLSDTDQRLSGVAIAATMEGFRPLLVEVQALVSSAVYGTPQRSSTGFDSRRLNMLLAVLEKRCGFRLGLKDVFLNIAGGIRVDDPAIDLAVVCSILSSGEDMVIERTSCFAAELGLSGEIRPVARIGQRIDEAGKLGFERIFVSKYNKDIDQKERKDIEVVKIGRIDEVLNKLFA